MSVIRIRKKLDSEILELPELKEFVGKMVDITIEESEPQPTKNAWAETDRLREQNAKLYPGPDVGVAIIREMRDSRHLQADE